MSVLKLQGILDAARRTLERRARAPRRAGARLAGEPAPGDLRRRRARAAWPPGRGACSTGCRALPRSSAGSTPRSCRSAASGRATSSPCSTCSCPASRALSYSNMTPELGGKTLDALLAGDVPKRTSSGHLGRRAGHAPGTIRVKPRRPWLRRRPCLGAALRRPSDAQAAGAHRPAQLRHHRPRAASTTTWRGAATGPSRSCLGDDLAGRDRHGQALGPARPRRRRLPDLAEVDASAGETRERRALPRSATPTRATPAPS